MMRYSTITGMTGSTLRESRYEETMKRYPVSPETKRLIQATVKRLYASPSTTVHERSHVHPLFFRKESSKRSLFSH